jgi:hypothetical protein
MDRYCCYITEFRGRDLPIFENFMVGKKARFESQPKAELGRNALASESCNENTEFAFLVLWIFVT